VYGVWYLLQSPGSAENKKTRATGNPVSSRSSQSKLAIQLVSEMIAIVPKLVNPIKRSHCPDAARLHNVSPFWYNENNI
jgi:hypothetical protein